MSHKSLDLVGVIAFIALASLLTLIGVNQTVLRPVLALPLVLVLPGYALTAALFPRQTLGLPERLALTLGVSLAVSTLGGLALNWTPWGLQENSWWVMLAGVTLGASSIALLRRRKYPASDPKPSATGLSVHHVLLFGVAALVVLGAIALSLSGALQPRAGFTQLWMLPADETHSDTVRLGVRSMELATTRYRLSLKVGDITIDEWPAIVLAPGEQWETEVVLPIGLSGTVPVEAVLSRLDASEETYQHALLWWRITTWD